MRARIVIAGIGNVFLGDDGFGVELARRLVDAGLPEGVVVIDIGVRGVHLAYELLHTPDLLILLDAVRRGAEPGTLFVIEPSLGEDLSDGPCDAHGMDVHSIFSALERLGGARVRTVVVGCEPADLGEGMELSEPVRRALEPALGLVREVVRRELFERAARRQDEPEHSKAS